MKSSPLFRFLPTFGLSLLLLGLAIAPRSAQATEPAQGSGASIEILSPGDGAHLDADEAYPLQYAVTPGVGGDHFHVWVDTTRGPGVHTLKGTYTLPKL